MSRCNIILQNLSLYLELNKWIKKHVNQAGIRALRVFIFNKDRNLLINHTYNPARKIPNAS